MRILYVGVLAHGSTSLQRVHALSELGHAVDTLDLFPPPSRWERYSPFRVLSRLGWKVDRTGANRAIRQRARAEIYDVLWVDKGITIRPDSLLWFRRLQPHAKLITYSPDDMMNPRNQSIQYRMALPLYDLHVTTKSYNAHELLTLGARRTHFQGNAFDPRTHRPLVLSEGDRKRWACDVGFVGAFERERAQTMLALARAGVPVVARTGPNWAPMVGLHPNLSVVLSPPFIAGDDYAKAICATRINLGFLRKENRDLQTTRSVEIPACRAFMLAERTDEHRALFEEGKEAEYFGSVGELVEKARYYLEHESERCAIAEAGHQRCLTSGYTYADRLREVLELAFRT